MSNKCNNKNPRVRDTVQDRLGGWRISANAISGTIPDELSQLGAGLSLWYAGDLRLSGTIGSELARQICQFGPASIALVDNGEFNLYQIDHELGTSFADIPRAAILADVRNRQRIATLIADEPCDGNAAQKWQYDAASSSVRVEFVLLS